MVQIKSELKRYGHDVVKISVPDAGLDLAKAGRLAREKARALDHNAMMLSFHSGKTGEYWPNYECGGDGRPTWIVFAEARGYNLLVDVNDGDFEFFYLRM